MGFIQKTIVVICMSFTVLNASAQEEQGSDTLDLMGMSFEELMNVRIVSASREDERLFDSPVTSFVITRRDIVNSGATSIPDALRLAPGLIVREMANGSYDVSIRGGKDGLVSHQWWYESTSILAMINNRVIFNYYNGGVFWQNLPVDVADVERIEIVYGPNAPLYGPNALDGVINIITRTSDGDPDSYGSATIQAGENLLFSALGGKTVSDELELNISVNHSVRKRARVEYYDPVAKSYISDPRLHSDPVLASNPNLLLPGGDISSQRTGIVVNMYYKPTSGAAFAFATAHNASDGLLGATSGMNLQHISNNSLSHMVKAELGNFTFQSSIIRGHLASFGDVSEKSYDYLTWDNYVDYNLKVGDKLSLRPSISYQHAMINDKPYSVNVGREGLFNNRASMRNYAGAFKANYAPSKSWRLIGAVRVDEFKKPDGEFVSYQGIVTYQPRENMMIRALVGRSYSSSFIESTYMNWTALDDPLLKLTVWGNEDKDLLQNNIIELGYRMHFGKAVSFDISLFRQAYSDFTAFETHIIREFSPELLKPAEWEVKANNVALESRQIGSTFAATFLLGEVKVTPSLTIQRTTLSNLTPYDGGVPHAIDAPHTTAGEQADVTSDFAPDAFGGFMIDAPVNKWNFNVSGYYYGQYRLTGLNSYSLDGSVNDNEIDHIAGKFLINSKVGYSFSNSVVGFVNVRNLLGSSAREAYGSDRIGRMFFAGVNIEF